MIDEDNTNMNSKDSMFTALFGEKQNLLELYNAVKGLNYPKDTKIEIVTLSNVFYLKQKNDLAFTIDDKFVVLIEHQSTINENMPLRMLTYIGREYEKLVNIRDRYKRKIVKIPTPEFIVLYNGDRKIPDFMELKLSDAFSVKNDKLPLELIVKAYNINKGRNAELANKSRTLSEYGEFIALIKENLKKMKLREAIKQAVKTCLNRKILLSFLKRYSSEVENMLLTGWNTKDAIAFNRNRGREEGMKKVFTLLEKGLSLAEAKKQLKLS